MRWLLIMLLCLPVTGHALDRYRVSYDDVNEVISVTACFEGQAPNRFYHGQKAGSYTRGITANKRGFTVRKGSRLVRLTRLPEDSCLNWSVDVGRAADKGDQRLAMRVGEDLVMNTDLWFWKGPMERDILVDVELPEGLNISTPWAPTGKPFQFRPYKTPSSWVSRTAIGRFPVQEFSAGSGRFRLAALGGMDSGQQSKFEQWISHTAESVSSVCGVFPREQMQVLIIPIGNRRQPVPWAHVVRGGGIAAEFFVNENAGLSDLSSDWTASHEFSHALLPFVSRKDRWLSEGLASYYQWVLLARSGALSERDAWQGMVDGFGRGQRDTNRGTLAEVTLEGWEHTMRVYWSGAAMMLLADTRLRAASNGEQSLDTALSALQECCLESGRNWRASEVFSRLDSLTGTRVFSDLLDDHVRSIRFPDVSPTLESLGVVNRRGRVRLIDEPEHARIRSEIMRAPTGS